MIPSNVDAAPPPPPPICGLAAVRFGFGYIAALRDSELGTCMPTGWYSTYLTSPIRPNSMTQQLSWIFAFHSRTHRGSFTDTLVYMLKPFYINPNTRTFRSMLESSEPFTLHYITLHYMRHDAVCVVLFTALSLYWIRC